MNDAYYSKVSLTKKKGYFYNKEISGNLHEQHNLDIEPIK